MTTESGKNIESQVQRLARNGAFLAIGGVVAQLALTLLEVLAARKLGAEIYGVFVTAYAWTVLGSFLMELGTPMWTIQEGSRHHNRLPQLLASGLAVNFSMFAVLYLLLVLGAHFLAPNPVLGFLLILLPYGLILTVQNQLAAVYSSYQTMQVNAFFQGLAPLAILAMFFFYAAGELALADVGFAFIVGGAIVTGTWLAIALRRIKPRIGRGSIRETLRSSYQYGLSGILGHVYFKADIIMLSALAGLREAGIYAAAFKLVDLVYKVAVLSGRVFAPAIFKASHEPGKTFKVLASMMTRFLAIAGLVAGVAAFILAEELILLLFGEKYAASIPVLRILGGVMATKCVMVALQLLLSSIDLHFQRVVSLSVAVVAHLGANAILIPIFGAEGAAWAALFSGVLLILLYAWSSARHRDFQFLRWLLVPTCLASAACTATLFFDMNTLVSAVVSVSVFLISLLLTGFVQRDEIRFVFRSILPDGSQ